MLISGTAQVAGESYYFNRIETKTKIGWYLYNRVIETEDGGSYQIDIDSLYKFKRGDLKPFLVSAQEVTIEEMRYWGNPRLIEMLLESFNEVRNLKNSEESTQELQIKEGKVITVTNIEKDSMCTIGHLQRHRIKKEKINKDKTGLFNLPSIKETDVYNQEVHSITFNHKGTSMNTTDSSVRTPKYSTMNVIWRTLDLANINNREDRDRLLATKQKSIDQLRIEHDLSYYFDEYGNSKKDYMVVDTLKELTRLAREEFPKIKLWAVDIESTGLKMYAGKDRDNFDNTVSIMMSWKKNQAIFIPIDMEYMNNIEEGWVDILKPWLEKIPAVGHNFGFDVAGLYGQYGIRVNAQHCTRQLNFNLNCYKAKFNNSLQFLEEELLGIKPISLIDIFGSRKLAGLFKYVNTVELALLYACPDVEYCLEIFHILFNKLDVSCQKGYKLDMDIMSHVARMDTIGNRVNTDLAVKLRKANKEDMELLEEMIYSLVGQNLALVSKVEEITERVLKDKISEEEQRIALENFLDSRDYKDARHVFKIGSSDVLGDLMFNKMKYPIQGRSVKTGLPSVDAKSLGALLRFKNSNSGRLNKDILSRESRVFNAKIPLIKKDEYNKLDYPLASLIVEHRLRSKRDSTFFKQLLDTSIEGRYYSHSKTATAETFRIINVIQTLQGFMKRMIIPYDDEHYMIVFDFSQIEYRFMAGLGKQKDLIKSLDNPRADFHKEGCAMLNGIFVWLVTTAMRNAGKALNFAIPYGTGEYSVAESLYKKVTIETVTKARRQLNRWKETFSDIWSMLEGKRMEALNNGYVENPIGRRRYFYNGEVEGSNGAKLEEWKSELNRSRRGAINRAAGNYPIQSGAADLFKIAFRNFRVRLEKEGLEDLVKTTALVHDEIVSSVHKSVNKYYIYKIIYEECMLVIKDHPRYFAGISIVDTWYEGKEDLFEAPIEFVQHVINTGLADEKFVYQENAKEETLRDIKEYIDNVFIEELSGLGFNLSNRKLNVAELIKNLKEYFIRDKICLYHKVPKYKGEIDDDYEDDYFIRCLEEFIIAHTKLEGHILIYPKDYPKGERAILTAKSRAFIDEQGEIVHTEKYEEPTKDKDTAGVLGVQQEGLKEDWDLDLESDSEELEFEENDFEMSEISEFTNSEDLSVNMLRMFEMEEGSEDGIFNNTIHYVIPQSLIKDEQARVDEQPEKFNLKYNELSSKVRLTSNKVIVDLTDLNSDVKKELVDYLNELTTFESDLSAVRFVKKIGTQYDESDIYLKNIDIEKLRGIVDETRIKV